MFMQAIHTCVYVCVWANCVFWHHFAFCLQTSKGEYTAHLRWFVFVCFSFAFSRSLSLPRKGKQWLNNSFFLWKLQFLRSVRENSFFICSFTYVCLSVCVCVCQLRLNYKWHIKSVHLLTSKWRPICQTAKKK